MSILKEKKYYTCGKKFQKRIQIILIDKDKVIMVDENVIFKKSIECV